MRRARSSRNRDRFLGRSQAEEAELATGGVDEWIDVYAAGRGMVGDAVAAVIGIERHIATTAVSAAMMMAGVRVRVRMWMRVTMRMLVMLDGDVTVMTMRPLVQREMHRRRRDEAGGECRQHDSAKQPDTIHHRRIRTASCVRWMETGRRPSSALCANGAGAG